MRKHISSKLLFCVLALLFTLICTAVLIVYIMDVFKSIKIEETSGVKVNPGEDCRLDLDVFVEGNRVLTGKLGLNIPSVIGKVKTNCVPEPGFNKCYNYGDYATLQVSTENADNCSRLVWSSTYARRLEDCFDLVEGVHWYGGGETFVQTWPIEGMTRGEAPMVTGDSLAGNEYGSVTENYWLTSSGVAIYAEEDVPLFVSWRSVRHNSMCLVAENKWPYKQRSKLELKYNICTGKNVKEVHMSTLQKFYSIPSGSPDPGMLLRPFWSTWAQYHADVNQTSVMLYANRLISEGFTSNSHIEIDDNWESCYGELEFNSTKFSNVADCPSFETAVEKKYFVKDEKEKPGLTGWWQDQGVPSGIIDFTNPEAVTWWTARVDSLRTRYGIDSFKFDAGEANWLPRSINLTGHDNIQPNLYTTKYVEAVAKFGGMVEVRSGRRNQKEAIFTRMLDKDCRWGYDNGLQSLIPTLLHIGIVGYPFVLPDMIGGNAYHNRPSAELYIRWMQANAFMPAVQFSLVPWDFGPKVVEVCKKMLALREKYASALSKAVNDSLTDGSPINRPIWWEDPEDSMTYTIDSQYMLGGDILVAPVLFEGATTRNIYLPRGKWIGSNGAIYEGPTELMDFSAPLDVLPYFIKSPTTTVL